MWFPAYHLRLALPQPAAQPGARRREPQAQLDALTHIMTSRATTSVLSRAGDAPGCRPCSKALVRCWRLAVAPASPGAPPWLRLDAIMLALNASPEAPPISLPPPCFSTELPANAFRGCYGTDYISHSCQPRPKRPSAGRSRGFRRYGSTLYRRTERHAQRGQITTLSG